jgi:hypothetical protein
MQFNSHASSQDICSYADRLVKTTVTSFPLVDKTLFANEASRIIWSWIFQAYGGWVYDDSNQTTLPSATASLVSGQSTYNLPTDSAHILSVSVKGNGSNVWEKLKPLTLEQIPGAEPEYQTTDASPLQYRLVGKILKLYPAPDYSQEASLRLEISRDVVSFATNDTTKTPGFDVEFHEAIPTFIALQQAKINQMPIKNDLLRDWLDYEVRIKKHYAQKYAELFPPRLINRDLTPNYR